jgi:hypothetical protein
MYPAIGDVAPHPSCVAVVVACRLELFLGLGRVDEGKERKKLNLRRKRF